MRRPSYLTACVFGVALAILAQQMAADAQDDAANSKAASKRSPGSQQQPASAERIAQWVRELDDDQYTVREAATAALSAAGKEAVAPLAKAAAGDGSEGGSLEVSARCVAILERLAGSDSAELADAARDALESLAPPRRTPASERAADALARLSARHAERAKKKLLQLGAVRGSGENFLRKDVERDDQLVITKKRWTGTIDDLRLLAYLPDITYVSIHGVRLNADALTHLSRLRQVRHIELYGTGLDSASIAKLREALPGLSVLDVRSGGVLGVSRFGLERCELREIIPDTPAARAGLQPMDVVTHVDGKPLDTYRALISHLRTCSGGDKVKLAIERGGKKIDVEVTLAAWGDE
jgi:hypothetical protein